MADHTIRLIGPGAHGARIAAPLLRDLVDALVAGAEQAVRLRVEGESGAQRKAPPWLERAASFDLVAVKEGSTQVVFDAPPIAEVAPDVVAMDALFSPFDTQRTCLDLLGETIADALAGNEDSDLYDDGLIGTIASFGKVLRHDIEAIELHVPSRSLWLERDNIEVVKRLRRRIPADRQVILVGKLDALRHRDRVFTLLLDTGEAVRGVLTGGPMDATDAAEIGSLWGRRVRVGGVAKFRPSGRLLRVDAAGVEEAAEEGSFFSRMPAPIVRQSDPRAFERPQTPERGVGAFFGTWPGDETDEELLAMLRELRSRPAHPS